MFAGETSEMRAETEQLIRTRKCTRHSHTPTSYNLPQYRSAHTRIEREFLSHLVVVYCAVFRPRLACVAMCFSRSNNYLPRVCQVVGLCRHFVPLLRAFDISVLSINRNSILGRYAFCRMLNE